MALEDIKQDSKTLFYWYNSAGKMSDYSSTTSQSFGTGKANTANMVAKWNSNGYGSQNSRDMWGSNTKPSKTRMVRTIKRRMGSICRKLRNNKE